MLDIDHFKRYNDTFGHAAGDTTIKELGLVLRGAIRGGDVACRHGGEEFVLILPEAPLEISYRRAEEIRQAVRHLSVMHEGQPLGLLTISVGVAAYPDHGNTPAALLRAADSALYQAKHAGRDRVVAAEAERLPAGY
jgi:diguanylate cyclase (GGDEF)-like protein